jgi:hypothetical protein
MPVDQPLGPVRLSIPASAAYDLESFQRSISRLAERLGCPTCFSGADCTFELERSFVLRSDLDVEFLRDRDPESLTFSSSSQPSKLGVSMTPDAAFDLDTIQEAVATIAEDIGCPACHSGFDVTFQNELDYQITQKGLRG